MRTFLLSIGVLSVLSLGVVACKTEEVKRPAAEMPNNSFKEVEPTALRKEWTKDGLLSYLSGKYAVMDSAIDPERPTLTSIRFAPIKMNGRYGILKAHVTKSGDVKELHWLMRTKEEWPALSESSNEYKFIEALQPATEKDYKDMIVTLKANYGEPHSYGDDHQVWSEKAVTADYYRDGQSLNIGWLTSIAK